MIIRIIITDTKSVKIITALEEITLFPKTLQKGILGKVM